MTLVRRIATLAAALALAAAVPAGATSVVLLPLARIAGAAARVVHATVGEVRAGRDDAGLPATWITLDVARTLKGGAERRIVFKQYGVAEPLPDGTVARVPGLPRYAVGDEIVVFLRGESRCGFTSPVGLAQGVYRVEHHGARASVRDDGVSRGRRDLDAFLDEVSRLVGR